jgi:hypothetical protein
METAFKATRETEHTHTHTHTHTYMYEPPSLNFSAETKIQNAVG